jgi:transposase-like protein
MEFEVKSTKLQKSKKRKREVALDVRTPKEVPEKDWNEMVAAVGSGTSVREVARKYSIDRNTLNRYLHVRRRNAMAGD